MRYGRRKKAFEPLPLVGSYLTAVALSLQFRAIRGSFFGPADLWSLEYVLGLEMALAGKKRPRSSSFEM